MSKVLNSHVIKSILKRANDQHEKLMLQSSFRALEREKRCLREVRQYPDPAPKHLTREQFETRGPFYEFVLAPEVAQLLARIDRWLERAVEQKEGWIDKTDDSGRVTRLRNIKTLEDALALCEEDEARARRSRLARKDLDDGNDPRDVQLAQRFPDGTFAVQLKTPGALRWEGRHMRHCLSSNVYARRLTESGMKYFSIRDAQGRPRVTLEVLDRYVLECRGRANSDPFPTYGTKIGWLTETMGWAHRSPCGLFEPERLRHIGGVLPLLGHDLGSLPWMNGKLIWPHPSITTVGKALEVRRSPRAEPSLGRWLAGTRATPTRRPHATA